MHSSENSHKVIPVDTEVINNSSINDLIINFVFAIRSIGIMNITPDTKK